MAKRKFFSRTASVGASAAALQQLQTQWMRHVMRASFALGHYKAEEARIVEYCLAMFFNNKFPVTPVNTSELV